MKKILLLMLMALPFVFTSCSDDDNEKDSKKDELVGTTFAVHAYNNPIFIGGGKVYWVFRFREDGKVEQSAREDSHKGKIIGDVDYGTYVYKYPTVTIYLNDKEYIGTFADEYLFKMDYGIYKNLNFIKQDD